MNGTFDPVNHIYRIDGRIVPSVTQVISGLGLLEAAKYATPEDLQRGTFVHNAVQYALEGTLDPSTVDDSIRPRVNALLRFIDDVGIDPTLHPCSIEQPLYCDAPPFAGKPDYKGALPRLNEADALVDWKSGSVERVVGLQLAGYDILSGGRRRKRYAVQPFPDRNPPYKLHEFKDPSDYAQFYAALSLFTAYKFRPVDPERQKGTSHERAA